MFAKKIPLFNLFGFKVGIDITWFILAIFITWSLAESFFPHHFEGFSSATYWWMGVAGAVGLFVSIVFHEFCHSIVARWFGMPMKGITLFIFGGVAEMEQEPPSAKAEFGMAIAGPISSVLLAGGMYLVHLAGEGIGWPKPINSVLQYMVWLNLILAGFNILPAFPLDGGRVLRSILWGVKKNIRWATRIASSMGSGFGVILIVLGIFIFIGGNPLGGVWFFLIGMFIRAASQISYKQLLMRRALGGEPVRRFMKSEPVTVSSSASIEQLVDGYFYKYHFKMFPVLENSQLIGCVTSNRVKKIPKDEWDQHSVRELVEPCSEGNSIDSETDAMKALSIMNRTGNSRLMVVDGDQLVGIITLKDMLKFFALKIDLEGEGS
jgi:Zn-dependent protease/CBS domain-containing protein